MPISEIRVGMPIEWKRFSIASMPRLAVSTSFALASTPRTRVANLANRAGFAWHNSSCPAAPYRAQTRAMCDVVFTAQPMLQLMARPISAVCTASGQTIVRQTACPHQTGARIIILRIFQRRLYIPHDRAQQTFRQLIRQTHRIALCGEIPLHRVHHNVGSTAGGLVIRQGICDGRIDNSKSAAAAFVV